MDLDYCKIKIIIINKKENKTLGNLRETYLLLELKEN